MRMDKLLRVTATLSICAGLGLWPAAPLCGQENVQRISADDFSSSLFGFNIANFGAAVAFSDDFGATGSPALVVGAPEGQAFGNQALLSVLDANSGSHIRSIGNTAEGVRFGFALDCVNTTIDGAPRTLILAGAPDVGEEGGLEFVALYDDAENLLTRIDNPLGAGSRTLFGYAVAFVGDLNLDGHPDFAVGAPLEPHGKGATGMLRIYSGDPELATPQVLLMRRGAGNFGAALDGLGDLDGDDMPEILVGAPGVGLAVVLRTIEPQVLMPRSEVLHVLGGALQPGRTTPSYCAAAGDFDEDGFPDVVIQHEQRTVRVYSSRTGALLREILVPESGERDLVVGGAGDYDADGHPDLAVGDPRDATFDVGFGIPQSDGRLYVLSGRPEAQASETAAALLTFLPGAADTQGWAFTSLGDLDGNGFPELAVGAPKMKEDDGFAPTGGEGDGSVSIFAYKVTPENHRTLFGRQRDADFGWDVTGGFDIDGEPGDDVAISAPRDDGAHTDAGRVRAYQGASGALISDVAGTAPGDYLGFSIVLMPDLNGDGHADLLAAAPGADDGASADVGAVYALSGADGTLVYPPVLGAAAGDHLGVSIARAGLVDSDSIEDFIVGASRCLHFRPTDACDALGGYALVCSGADGSVIRTLSEPDAEEYGRYVDGNGHVTDDTVPDFLVSAPSDDFAGSIGGEPPGRGAVFVYSGANGKLIQALRGDPNGPDGLDDEDEDEIAQYGVNPLFIDFDGLGRDDVCISAHEKIGSGSSARVHGLLRILDGGAGAGWAELDSSGVRNYPYPAFAGFGYAAARLGRSGDGQPDTLVYSDPASGNRDVQGLVQGWNNPKIPTIIGFTDWDYYGYSISSVSDVDGDGLEDHVVGTPTDPSNEGNFEVETGWNRAMLVLSGKTAARGARSDRRR